MVAVVVVVGYGSRTEYYSAPPASTPLETTLEETGTVMTTTVMRTTPKPKPISTVPTATTGESARGGEDAFVAKTVRDQLHRGAVAFNVPERLARGATAEIEFLVSPEQTAETLKESITQPGVRRGRAVEVSDYMKADLASPSFDITRIGDAEKLVVAGRKTRWAWDITPKQTGVLKLHLTLTAIVTSGNEDRPLEIETFNESVSIHVGWGTRARDFVGTNWQWLWGAILVPVGLWVVQRRRRIAKPGADPPPAN